MGEAVLVKQALQILEKYKELAGEGTPAPHIFLDDIPGGRSKEVAQFLANATGFPVFLFKDSNAYEALTHITGKIKSFKPFIDQTDAYEPSTGGNKMEVISVLGGGPT